MQQKHFNNPRIYNNHRSATSIGNRINTNITTRQPRLTNEHQILTNPENGTNTNDNRTAASLRFNQRLTSVGGLFATLSIIITGALLYAIFTAKSQDKWYYISAVLINISLLIILMVGAVLFDKYYLKKYSNTTNNSTLTSSPISSSTASSASSSTTQNNLVNPSNRIMNLNSVVYPNSHSYNSQNNNSLISIESPNSMDASHQIYLSRNDVPPQYPDITPLLNLNDKDKDVNTRRNHQINSHLATATENSTHIINELNNDKSQITNNSKLDSPLNQPPNYFDLYPISDSTTDMNHSLGSSSLNA